MIPSMRPFLAATLFVSDAKIGAATPRLSLRRAISPVIIPHLADWTCGRSVRTVPVPREPRSLHHFVFLDGFLLTPKHRRLHRRSLCQQLEPRMMLHAAPIAVDDRWYSTPQDIALIIGSSDTTLLANDGHPQGNSPTAFTPGASPPLLSSNRRCLDFPCTPQPGALACHT
jgi:hypothetical protein